MKFIEKLKEQTTKLQKSLDQYQDIFSWDMETEFVTCENCNNGVHEKDAISPYGDSGSILWCPQCVSTEDHDCSNGQDSGCRVCASINEVI